MFERCYVESADEQRTEIPLESLSRILRDNTGLSIILVTYPEVTFPGQCDREITISSIAELQALSRYTASVKLTDDFIQRAKSLTVYRTYYQR